MATDHATTLEGPPETDAYISPTADFLVLSIATTGVALAGAAVIIF